MEAAFNFINTSKKCYKVLFVLLWIQSTLLSFTINILNSFFRGFYLGDILVAFLYTFFFILSLPYIYKKIKSIDIIAPCLFFIIYLFTYTLSDYTSVKNYLFDNAVQILLLNWCIYFIGLAFNDQDLMELLRRFSMLALIANIIGIWIFGISNLDSADNMGRAYRLLPHCLLFIHYVIRHKSILDFIFAMVSTVLILGFSSRGPLFLLLIFILLYFAITKRITLSVVSISLPLIFAIYYNFDNILLIVSKFLTILGMNQRLIEFLYSSSFFEFNSRDSIALLMLEVLSDNYWIGYGIAGDRLFSNTIIINNNGIAYSHNFFIEILFSYGILAGTLIIISTMYYTVKSTFFKSSDDAQIILLILMVSVFLKLFISSSYLVEPLFPLYIGMSIAVCRMQE